MAVLLAVDPGVKKAGYAVFEDGVLVEAGTVTATHATATADSIFQRTKNFGVSQVVIEKMRKYNQRSATHHDLDRVEAMARSLTACFRNRKVPVTRVYPAEWKGQATKTVTRRRTEKALSWGEIAAMLDNGHDTWDAVGIGLVATKRLKRGLV